MKDVNVVVLLARLTFDPELRSTPSGASVCNLRVAWSTSWKNADGSYEDRPNYGDVIVWGKQAEACAKYLEKGRQVCVHGRLQWRQWDEKDTGKKRSALEIVAEQVQFVSGGGGEGRGEAGSWAQTGQSDVPAPAGGDLGGPATPPPAATDDDSIPFAWDGPPRWEEMKSRVSRW